jgi:transcriptional regulator with XRE-family HTH domain
MTKMKVYKTTEIEVSGLGAKIKNLREKDGRDLTVICGLLQMSVTNWYRIEKESQSLPLETLRKIEAVLGVDFGVKLD